MGYKKPSFIEDIAEKLGIQKKGEFAIKVR